ncbi:MAG: hypothetical protein J07HR59_00746 [Halorubrum sp. J07HR59]|jgi:TolA-binding protein|nr:MAG: hypothetical protein J07HR59_00746 [Halorubrum sp. J07HR59]
MTDINSSGQNSIATELTADNSVADPVVDAVTALADQVANLTDRVNSLEDENQQLREQLDENESRMSALGTGIANANEQIEQLDEESGHDDRAPVDDSQNDTVTPIERLSEGDEDDVVQHVTPSVERAVTLYEHIADWGSRTPSGITLRPADSPKTLLEAAREESLAWQQYYRTAEALESLSKGAVTFVDHKKHGKTLVLHNDTELHDRLTDTTTDRSHSSLART